MTTSSAPEERAPRTLLSAFGSAILLLVLLGLSSGCGVLGKVDYGGLVTGGRDGWQHPQQVIAALQLGPGDRVAEIGAGNGYWLPWLSQAVGADGRVYAVEVTDELVEKLEARVAEEGWENVIVVRGAFEDPKLPDGEIDLAMTCLTYHHIEDRPEYFRKLRTDLSPSGRVTHLDDRHDVSPPFRWLQGKDHWSDPEEVRVEMSEAGYRLVASYGFLPMQSFQIFEPVKGRR